MARNNVKIVITVDDKGSPVIKKFATKAKGSLGGVESKAVSSAQGMKTAWLAAAAALGAVALGMSKLVKIGKEGIEAANMQARAVAGMETVFQSMGRTAPGLSDQMMDLASSLQRVTNFGDEATIEGVKFLGTYKDITDDLLPRTVKAMLDLAAATGRDTVGAANMLGKASMGMTGELRRVGISVDAATFKTRGYVGVLELIENQFGGQAEVMRSAEGSYTALGNEVSEIKERFGELLKVKLGSTFEDWAGKINQFNEGMAKQIEILKEEMAGVREEIIWMGDATTTMLTLSSAAAKELAKGAEMFGGEGGPIMDPEKFAAAYAAAEEKKNQKVAEIREAQAVADRTKEEAQAIELQERSIEQATALAEEKLRIWIERNNAEVEAEKLKEQQITEMQAEAVIQAKETAEAKLRASIAQDNAEIASEKKKMESDKQLTKNWMEQSLAMAASQNKKAWRLYQAYRISEAIVDTIEAAQASYRWGASWGGPIAGGVMAAIATAAGIMRVAQIAGEKPKAREGGVFTGPSSGYSAELHGTEAVVPLPGGRSIPVEMAGGGAGGLTVNLTLQAMDTETANEFMERNPQAVIAPLMTALQAGHRGLTTTIKETTQTN